MNFKSDKDFQSMTGQYLSKPKKVSKEKRRERSEKIWGEGGELSSRYDKCLKHGRSDGLCSCGYGPS